MNADESNMKMVFAPFTPIPIRRQKTFVLEAGASVAHFDVMQRLQDNGNLISIAQVRILLLHDTVSCLL